eukprot:5813187-Pleurochrysis_carterae.AAC.2
MSQALTTACARLFTVAYDLRDAQPVTPAAALACEGMLAWDNEAADADCVHGCAAWCASEARLQAAIKIGRQSLL